MREVLLADWNKIAAIVTAVATVVALGLSWLALRQNSLNRLEDTRDRLLGTLIEQLTELRRRQQQVRGIRREIEPTTVQQSVTFASAARMADQLLAQLAQDIGAVELLHRSIVAANSASREDFANWRSSIDQHGTMFPQMELQISELATFVERNSLQSLQSR